MLDAMFPATAAMLAGDGADIPASAAQKGADATAAMTNAEAGRSNYLSEEVLRARAHQTLARCCCPGSRNIGESCCLT